MNNLLCLQLDILPQWLSALLTEKFFNACLIHEDARKNEKNIFCFDCCEGICPNCSSQHKNHCLLQIRRYVYHDVIKLDDAEKLMDCEFVHTYISNGAKVIFLNQRPYTRRKTTIRGSTACVVCDRALQDAFIYCSLYCKLQHIIENGCNLSKYIRRWCEDENLPECPEPGLEDGQLTPDTVLEPAYSLKTESAGSSGSNGYNGGGLSCGSLACTATTDVTRKKRSNTLGFRPACGPVLEMCNRRKGNPQRAPLY
ncbi:OLC1v1002162C2 [Oldenlandia corymbosa var. corymbosa]|uniref:OLC1v1002162C2 n=1 Tax=Oldenlandia corymbosa var. corymbosa TaxID=529605 RepID=A0AAV1D8L2_OLDCO|nr:OLC1v1002162C2 [Oldenlandia corymbosa var. corymbosa]